MDNIWYKKGNPPCVQHFGVATLKVLNFCPPKATWQIYQNKHLIKLPNKGIVVVIM